MKPDRGTDWAAAAQTFNLTETSELTGLSRSTLERMLAEGCPFVERADRDRRKEWKLNIADVFAWRTVQKRKERNQQPTIDPLTADQVEDLIYQLRDFLAAIGPEPDAKRRKTMIRNFSDVLGRFELYLGKA